MSNPTTPNNFCQMLSQQGTFKLKSNGECSENENWSKKELESQMVVGYFLSLNLLSAV